MTTHDPAAEPTRRAFLSTTLAASAGLALASASARAAGANDTIRLGTVGTGGRCQQLLDALQPISQVEVVALCDVWDDAIRAGLKRAPHAAVYKDYRAVLDRQDVDGVVIATPDHWHTPALIAALDAGKDVYVEKPLAHTLDENPRLLEAARMHRDRVVEVGMQQRSMPHLVKCYEEVIRPGTLGKVYDVRLWWNYSAYPNRGGKPPVDPKSVDWETWLGPAAARPFDPYRFRAWRNFWDYGGGHIADLMTHFIDVVHWWMDQTLPVRAQTAGGTWFSQDGRDTPDVAQVMLTYPDKLVVTFQGNQSNGAGGAGMIFSGTNGTLYADRQLYELKPEAGRGKTAFYHHGDRPRGAWDTRTDQDTLHLADWVRCMRSRKTPRVTIEMGVNAATASNLANKALKSGRTEPLG